MFNSRAPQYEGYFIMRWLGGVGGAKCGGGWYDPFGTTEQTYVEQARQTVLGGAGESLLFCYGALLRGTGPNRKRTRTYAYDDRPCGRPDRPASGVSSIIGSPRRPDAPESPRRRLQAGATQAAADRHGAERRGSHRHRRQFRRAVSAGVPDRCQQVGGPGQGRQAGGQPGPRDGQVAQARV